MSKKNLYPYNNDKPFLWILCAKPKQGKSVAIRECIYELARNDVINNAWIISPTAAINGDYDFLPSSAIIKTQSVDIIDKIIKFQEQNPKSRPSLLVFDDCAAKFPWKRIEQLFMNHRHYNLSIIVATQYINKVTPTIRQCCYYWSFLGSMSTRSINAIKDEVFPEQRTEKIAALISRVCRNHNMLFVATDDQFIGSYKADLIPETFKIHKFWSGKNLPDDPEKRADYITE